MKELQDHVEHLFAKQRRTAETEELKQEILSNLEEKVADYQLEGMSYEESIAKAKRSITSLDFLMEEDSAIYIYRYRLEWMQTLLIYLLIIWIFTLPMTLIQPGFWLSVLVPVAIGASLLAYAFLSYRYKQEGRLDQLAAIDIQQRRQASRIAWTIWGLFVIIMLLFVTAMNFGSQIWFGRAIQVNGPYQFALLLIDYVKPLTSIVIPLMFHQSARLPHKYEVNRYANEE
ncbi:permease prefix domain 1-containing protein [Paenibacillus senegalensis]|uniref:permease prefix domain 1-containing protein n=1 Tax=Paenibacillus senegalensis TaxID=1465766 RepID=UPI0002892872|nr:permease prefix domain 1-containing protein [Paenibacillus senegalensis]